MTRGDCSTCDHKPRNAADGEIERFRAECNALRKELAEANSFIESLAKACQAAEARAIEAEAEAAAIKTNIVRKHKSARMSDPATGDE